MMSDLKLFDGIVLFTQVVNGGGFSAAAAINGHSTSFISKQISKLESRLGVRLLSRTTRKISLTPEGNAFYQQCEQMIIDAEQALGIINQANTQPKGVLKISCPIGYGITHLQAILLEYSQLYPDVKKITSYKSYIIASHHYLALHGTPTKPQDLLTHQCLSYSHLKHPTKWKFETLTGEISYVDVPATILCNNAEMELAMVLQHKGICFLPEFYLQKELEEKQVAILFADFKQPDINIYALYPSRKHLSPKVRAFIDLLADRLS